jgi:hypothetical protein
VSQQVTRTNPLLRRVLAALDDTEVRWVLLRGRAGLALPGRDVDLLVSADDLGSLEDVVFDHGGMALPRSMHPWHRFYVLEDPQSGNSIKLDVVSQLVFSRELRIASGLESTCLERRRREDGLYVLDPTDMFWTVLLHCVLDKQEVNQRRASELEAAVHVVNRPSPGEAFFEGLCPPGWSADRAVEAVRGRDWDSLALLGRQVVSRPMPSEVRRTAAIGAAPRTMARAMARVIYPTVWRAAGLGATPQVLDVVDAVSVDATVVGLSRRPGVCEVSLLVPDEQKERLVAALQRKRYRYAAGGWNRVTKSGLERVRVFSAAQLPLPARAMEDIRSSSSPMHRRTHCRRASAGATVLVTATAASAGLVDRGAVARLAAASGDALAEAHRLATAHGVHAGIEGLTARGRAS